MHQSKKILSITTLVTLGSIVIAGCGSKPPARSEFTNEVITEVPEVPGANQRYPLPELKTNSSKTEPSTGEEPSAEVENSNE